MARTCLCAPTMHAGSFRCRLHRSTEKGWAGRPIRASSSSSTAKGPHATAETASSRPVGDNRSGKRFTVPFAARRSNRVMSASKSSETKLCTDALNDKALIACKKDEILGPSVEELRIISPSDDQLQVPKSKASFKIAAKTTAELVPGAGSTIALRIVQSEDQENAATVTDLASAKLQKEVAADALHCNVCMNA
ncbi:unnamed protein product [Sphagnum jensenii]|uniref:Uncharacterized protein n=1 Tax=Sphagnum jensenii TaxID=128206 RepID=A0ABP1B943_9BRYO